MALQKPSGFLPIEVRDQLHMPVSHVLAHSPHCVCATQGNLEERMVSVDAASSLRFLGCSKRELCQSGG